jgi:hypothetical protein
MLNSWTFYVMSMSFGLIPASIYDYGYIDTFGYPEIHTFAVIFSLSLAKFGEKFYYFLHVTFKITF